MKRLLYIGNGDPPFSTENHYAASFRAEGVEVVFAQEDRTDWADRLRLAKEHEVDAAAWTCTWHGVDVDNAAAALDVLHTNNVTTFGLHLDLYVGLDRQAQIASDPWWKCQWMMTADGDPDHQRWFDTHGIRHRWVPPGVYDAECYLAEPNPRVRAEIVWVGSWRRYHPEWLDWRRKMIAGLARRYRSRFTLAGDGRNRTVRGEQLNRLLASVKVVVGDSCLADRLAGYTSDRLFETPGRGGLLVYPRIPLVDGDLMVDGTHYYAYKPADLDSLIATVDRALDDPDRESIRLAGHEHVKANHTYRHRVRTILEHLS